MLRRLSAVLAALVLVASCAGQTDEAADRATRTVRHTLGESEIPRNPERVVTLWAPTLSAAISLGERPVGYAFNDEPIEGVDVPEGYDLSEMQHLGDSVELNFERIAAAEPDLILATEVHEDAYDQLSDIAPTVVLPWPGASVWKRHLADVAEVLQRSDQAAEVAADYETRVAEVTRAIGDPGAIEASIVRFHAEELRLEVRNSFAGQIADDVGLSRPEPQDVEEEDSGYVPVSMEHLPKADGDVLFAFTIADGDEEQPDLLHRARDTPLWNQLTAVRTDAVHPVDYATWISSNYIGAQSVLNDIEKALG